MKNNAHPCKFCFTIEKWGLRGSKLHGCVSMLYFVFQHFLQAEVRYELRDKDQLMFGDAECVFQAYHKVCSWE